MSLETPNKPEWMLGYDRTIADCDEAIRLNEKDWYSYSLRSEAHRSKAEYDEAIADASRSIEIDPRNAMPYAVRAASYYETNHFEPAMIDANKAIELDPYNFFSYATRGACYYRLLDYDKALRDLNHSLSMNPHNAWALLYRACTYERLGELDKSILDSTEALRLNPADYRHHAIRGQAYLRKNLLDEAIAESTRAIEINPNDGWVRSIRAEAYRLKALNLANPRPAARREESGGFPIGGPSQAPALEQVVLLIHGMNTQGDWQGMVRGRLEVPGKIKVFPVGFSFFDPVRFWFPIWTRNGPTRRVEGQIRAAMQMGRKSNPNVKLSIIAHSFGAYVVGRLIREESDLKIDRLILCGSVLPQDFPWEQYQGRFDPDNFVNECGWSDIWPVLAQSMSWGYGASGTYGFKSVLARDRTHPGGHAQYFDKTFVETYWVPLIRSGQFIPSKFEDETPTTPLWLSLLGNLRLRWFIVAALIGLMALCWRIFGPINPFTKI